ncbi:hypothetical protein EV126DRAFT_435162 [Verticillium dahliae]|nr:hypothetical protein EV126DRAFT_435162 [Verticillium dahliae]
MLTAVALSQLAACLECLDCHEPGSTYSQGRLDEPSANLGSSGILELPVRQVAYIHYRVCSKHKQNFNYHLVYHVSSLDVSRRRYRPP